MVSLDCKNNLVFLVGFSGSGKTTAGRKLARRMGFIFCDLDDTIEICHGMSPTEIIDTLGLQEFRRLERKCLKQVLKKKHVVVACGGGTPCYSNNMQLMNDTGITVYLRMSHQALCHRIERGKTVRPLLKGLSGELLEKKVLKMLDSREVFYKQAKIIVEAENLSLTELMRLIKNYKEIPSET